MRRVHISALLLLFGMVVCTAAPPGEGTRTLSLRPATAPIEIDGLIGFAEEHQARW